MWWHDKARRLYRLVPALAVAALAGGCFQPLYGEHSALQGQGIASAMRSVDVAEISVPSGTSLARIAVEVRNDLISDLTGGTGTIAPTHRLTVNLGTGRTSVIVDVTSGRPDVEVANIDAGYRLTDLATGRVVVTGSTFARVSYNIPGQQQRFARTRGLRDAENRAAKVISEQIRARLASYFVAGT